MTRTAGLVSLLALAVICTVTVVGHSVGCKATSAEPTSAASPGVQETKFEPEELRGVLLEDSDVSPFKVAKQVEFRWPGPHGVGPGVEQYVEAVGRPTVLVFLFGFHNDEAAKAGADFWAHSMAEVFAEGGLHDVTVGESCWVSVSGSGAALVFQRGPFCASVGVITDVASERSIITEIAQKLDEKIVGYLGRAQVNDAPGSDQPEESQSGAEYSVGPYTLTRSASPELLVSGVDLKVLAKRHLPEFEWYRSRIIGAWGTRATLRDLARESKVDIRIAVYDCVREAENHALDALTSVSALSKRAIVANLAVGDSGNCWVSDRQAGSSVTFVRKNVLVAVSVYAANAPEEVRRIARAIDQDIVRGRDGVKLATMVPVPVIRRVGAPRALGIAATKEVEIDAVDPLNRELSFFAFTIGPGITASRMDRPNTLLFQGVKVGVHKLIVGAINQKNVIALWHGEIIVEE